jgi:hypothetical protein
MAELVSIEPTKSHLTGEPDGWAWFRLDDGRSYHRKLEREDNRCRSSFPTPMVMSDYIDPVKSQADGKVYDTKSGLYASYREDGNPQGIRYECVGNESLTNFTKKRGTKADRFRAFQRAADELGF